mmetsp:Transcript_18879/g.40836  ORF Transcript_18879/g.40836 Transcript_18879/m.40836 type:complete len:398 (-) Transcript_18879:390-1583(-)
MMPNEERNEDGASSTELELEVSPSASDDSDSTSANDVSLGKAEDLGHATTTTNEPFDIRQAVGQVTHRFSDLINENIIVARYATMATVLLLGTYGVSKTPFFFRYKSVSDIPAEYFTKRRALHGRIVHVLENNADSTAAASLAASKNTGIQNTSNVAEKPVICLVRHLSPVGRLLSKSAFDFSLSNSPSVRLGGRIEDSRDLLKIEIAGIKAPPFYRSAAGMEQPGEWLNRLAANRTPVACTLMARRVDNATSGVTNVATAKRGAKGDTFEIGESHVNERAICQVRYRPTMFSLFRQDLASTLVASGRASLLSGIHVDESSTSVIDGSTDLKNLQDDAKYLERLGADEFEAVKQNRGMWNDPIVRNERPDLVEEAEFEQTASAGKKLWRWIRERIGL